MVLSTTGKGLSIAKKENTERGAKHCETDCEWLGTTCKPKTDCEGPSTTCKMKQTVRG